VREEKSKTVFAGAGEKEEVIIATAQKKRWGNMEDGEKGLELSSETSKGGRFKEEGEQSWSGIGDKGIGREDPPAR